MKRSLTVETHAPSCYFRTSIGGDGRKALLQITERCNLRCAHCFVSAGPTGADMDLAGIVDVVLPRLRRARVERITITGGEPFVHPQFLQIARAVVDAGIALGVCSNATLIDDGQIAALAAMGDVHVNVSFDGFRPETHGLFRGDRSSFATTVATTRKLGEAGLLQGLLSTPNTLTAPEEFADLCRFAVDVGATYVLLNPLSAFGRGEKAIAKLGADDEAMRQIADVTGRLAGEDLEVVHVRFPNDAKPLSGCDAGKFLYIFADGLTAMCPYLVFAARSSLSVHPETDFTVGNIFDSEIAGVLDDDGFHHRFTVGSNAKCTSCSLTGTCGKGCPAAVVARGGRVGDVDAQLCPIPDSPVPDSPVPDGPASRRRVSGGPVPELLVPEGVVLLPMGPNAG